MNFGFTEEQELFRKTVRQFSEREVRPQYADRERPDYDLPAFLQRMAELGLLGLRAPVEDGGVRRKGGEPITRREPALPDRLAEQRGLPLAANSDEDILRIGQGGNEKYAFRVAGHGRIMRFEQVAQGERSESRCRLLGGHPVIIRCLHRLPGRGPTPRPRVEHAWV